MRLPFLLLASATLAACGQSDSDVPAKSVGEVMSSLNGAIAGCAAGLTEDGAIDQAGLAKAGWVITERTTRLNADEREHELDSLPELEASEYESTSWDSFQHHYPLELTRWNAQSKTRLADSCQLNARVDDSKAVKGVIAKLAEKFGRKADRSGTLPRGGDFLTPRFDKASTGYYWAMDQHDVYLTVGEDEHLRLEVVAMPDRGALDEYSSDNPEVRIPKLD